MNYIAPIYNSLINNGADIRYVEVTSVSVDFCGTLSEYPQFNGRFFEMKTIVADLDNTISFTKNGDYSAAEVDIEVVAKMREYKEMSQNCNSFR